jgi:nucleoside-diphosphate-sugar epimerase
MKPFTVLGSTGFVGSHLAAALLARDWPVQMPARDADLAGLDLGHVVYCIGMTADFRRRPFDTVEAHVGRLQQVLQRSHFTSLVYLSSTRVYRGTLAYEDRDLPLNPQSPSDLYNASKLMGESLALSCGKPAVVARLSNVYGPDFASANFLPSVIRAALHDRRVVLETALASAKDYVRVDDVVEVLIRLSLGARHRVYNVASGQNTSHGEITAALERLTGCAVSVAPAAPVVAFPSIDVRRLRAEFDYRPASLLDDLPALVGLYRQHQGDRA